MSKASRLGKYPSVMVLDIFSVQLSTHEHTWMSSANFTKRAWIFQRGVQQLFKIYVQLSLDAEDGFWPAFHILSCCDEPQLSGGTARFLLLHDTVF